MYLVKYVRSKFNIISDAVEFEQMPQNCTGHISPINSETFNKIVFFDLGDNLLMPALAMVGGAASVNK